MQYFWLSVGHSIKIFGTMKMLKKKIWCLLVPKRAILMAYEIYSWSLILQNKENFPHWRQIRLPGWWEKEKSNHMFPESCFFQKQPPDVFFKKKGVIRNFSKFTGKHLCQKLFFKKETLAQVFSCEFCEISTNTFFTKNLWATASIFLKLDICLTQLGARFYKIFINSNYFTKLIFYLHYRFWT